MKITLADAIREDRLGEFIAQEEARGHNPADAAEFDRALRKIVKQPRSEDRTSRSPSGSGSTGK